MASVRNLKKDIDFLVSEIISDCQIYMFIHRSDNKIGKAQTIIDEVIDWGNQLYARVNHPDGKNDKKLVKKHYVSIRKDLLMGANQYFEKISSLNK